MSDAQQADARAPPQASVQARRWYNPRWLQFLASGVLVGALLSTVDIDRARLLDSATALSWWPVALALLLRPAAVWARAWQAVLLLRSAGLGLDVREVWQAFMLGELLSRFVPANLGTVAYVAKLSGSPGIAIGVQFVDRILFLFFALAVAAISLLGAGYGSFALVATVALCVGLLLAHGLYRSMHWAPLVGARRQTIQDVLARRGDWGGTYVVASSLSLLLTTILFELLVVACAGSMHVFEGLGAVALVTIGSAIPITINGIGIREWVFAAFLKESLPSSEAIVTLAAMTYLMGFASALIGVSVWAVLPRKKERVDSEG